MTSERRKFVLERIRRKVKTLVPQGTEVLLYGSQARGDNHETSDWDILVLLDKDRISLNDIDEVSYPLRELGWELGEDINTVLYTKNDWKGNSFTPFYKNVVKEGILL